MSTKSQLLVNDEFFGSISMVGTRDEFRVAMQPAFQGWYNDREAPDMSYGDYVEMLLDEHLSPADAELDADKPRVA